MHPTTETSAEVGPDESRGPERPVRPVRTRRPWTREEKAEYLALFAESGLSATEFCRELDIPPATFALWRRAAQDAVTDAASAPPSAGATFAAVALREDAPEDGPARHAAAGPTAGGVTTPLTLTWRWPSGVEVVCTGLDATTVRDVVGALLTAVPRVVPPAPRA